eukprot:gene10287-18985_t
MVPKEAWIEENKKNQMIMMPSTSVHHGVGFCIRKVEDTKWKCISNRVASVKMNLPNLNVNCIVGYAPTSPVCDKYPEEREKFYKEIEDAWCPQSTNIILRDFNSKVGKRCDDTYPNNAGRFSTGTQNTGGADLLSFAQRKDMVLTNTLFKKKFGSRASWCGQAGAKKIYNQFDYIMVPNNLRHLITNSESQNSQEIETDYRMVIASMQMKETQGKKKGWYQASSKPDLEALQDQEQITVVRESFSNYRANNKEEGLLNLRMAMQESMKRLPRKKPIQSLKATTSCSEIEKLYKDKNEIHRRMKQHTMKAELRSEMKTARNAMNKRLRHLTRDRATFRIEQKIKILEEKSDEGLAFEAIKLLKRKTKAPKTIKLGTGEEKNDQQAMEKELRQHFTEVFFNENGEVDDVAMPKPLNTLITAAEVEAAITKLKNGKASGPDDIPAENLKTLKHQVTEELVVIMNSHFETGAEVDIGDGMLVPLRKPGKSNEAANFRPVILLDTVRKVFANVVLARIKPKVENFLPPS